MTDWYCKLLGETSGPFSLEELRFLKDRGKLSADDELRQGPTGPWAAAGSIETLFQDSATAGDTDQLGAISATPQNQEDSSQGEEGPRDTADAEQTDPEESSSENGPPPLPDDDGRLWGRQQILIGTGIGAGIALLILLLLFLFSRGDPGSVRDTMVVGGRRVEQDGSQGSGNEGAVGSSEDADSGTESPEETPSSDKADGNDAVPEGERSVDPSQEESSGEKPPEEELPEGSVHSIEAIPGGDDSAAGNGGGGEKASSGEGAKFFDVEAKGRRFVYIVDCSGSMSGGPFEKACTELMSSIKQLSSRQSFYVFFFDDQTYPMFAPDPPARRMMSASQKNITRLQEWVDTFQGGGNTDPQDALLRALKLKADAIFLLTDGEFDPLVVNIIRGENKRKTTINTIGFINRAGEPLLKEIARQNRGEYRFVP